MHLLISLLIPLLILLIALSYLFLRFRTRALCVKTITTLSEIHELLSSPGVGISPLESRALPNQRLVVAFGIDNSFTTVSKSKHKSFKNKVIRYINLNENDWQGTSDYVQSLCLRQLTESNGSLHLVPFLRQYVLTVVIRLLTPNAATDKKGSIAMLANLINDLWIQSKLGAPRVGDQKMLEEAIRAIFPDTHEQENPLNILLPAYETLWRVVLRCFLEVQFRGSTKWRQKFQVYLYDSSNHNFLEDGEGVSVFTIVKETLRLYPPTKRIYRAQSQSKFVAADIEQLHCSPEWWGEDATRFRPERWILGEVNNEAWMPFGAQPFVCPAKAVFAPRLIGILVAAVLEWVPKDVTWTAERKEDEIPNGEMRLGNERDGFDTLKLHWPRK